MTPEVAGGAVIEAVRDIVGIFFLEAFEIKAAPLRDEASSARHEQKLGAFCADKCGGAKNVGILRRI